MLWPFTDVANSIFPFLLFFTSDHCSEERQRETAERVASRGRELSLYLSRLCV